MARPLRIEYEGAHYHVTTRGNERKAIFRDDIDRRKFLEILSRADEQFDIRVHAYVLMDNHYHLMIETRRAGLNRALRYLNGVYTQSFNRRHRWVGHLFQGRDPARDQDTLGGCARTSGDGIRGIHRRGGEDA